MERSRLQQARTLAIRRQDYTEVATIDAKLAEVNAALPARDRGQEGSSDILAKLNERNRKLNHEQVRKAERAEMERKRRERQLRAGTSTPTAADRLKAKMLRADANSRSVSFRCAVSNRVGVNGSLTICLLARSALRSSLRPLSLRWIWISVLCYLSASLSGLASVPSLSSI